MKFACNCVQKHHYSGMSGTEHKAEATSVRIPIQYKLAGLPLNDSVKLPFKCCPTCGTKMEDEA